MATDTGTERRVDEASGRATSLPRGSASDSHTTRAVSVQHANAIRNAAGGSWARRLRWRHAREACWALLDRHVAPGARVAVVGAGNGDDLPLARLARRAGTLDLIDLDSRALKRARRRCAVTRTEVRALVEDVSGGRADRIVRGSLGEPVDISEVPCIPIGDGPYDVVIADFVATQLLYPALSDSGLPAARIEATLLAEGQRLTEAVTARLHAAAPAGDVVHLHDMLGWWPGHGQPFKLDAVLALAETDPAAALTLAGRANVPYGCDPRAASRALGAEIIGARFWRWPFAPGTDYLACATVARTRTATFASHAGSVR